MSLKTGARLGSYEVRGPLGTGGMGEVYRAWDGRLGREVALKVLPEAVANDPERLRRFEGEARAVGALNHPNVLAVYDVGSHESLPYIVSELLEGETLRGRLRAGGLTPRKAVEHAIQIARGLAAAHQRGIVHRDLKPENVFVTRDGQVKILDFGLAKLREEARGGSEHETETRETRPGVILGTVPYMSPEQIRGLPADARSDIFALGSVLYEMLARRRAFIGETASEVETAILREDPPELPTLDSRVPAALDRIVHRCLEKQAADRFQTAQDVAFALEAVGTATPSATLDAGGGGRWPRTLTLLTVLLTGLLAGALLLAVLRRPAAAPSYTQLTFRRGAILSARFSHDGETVVYSAAWNGQPAQVFTTRIGSPEARPLDIEGVVLSVSSRDEVAVKLGRFLVQHEHGKDQPGTLARFPLAGGAPRELLEDVTAADWDPEGRDLAVVRGNHRLEYPIGHAVYESEGVIFHVRVLPGGRLATVQFLEERQNEPQPYGVSLIDSAGKKTVLSPGWAGARGISWSQATREIFFAGSRGDEIGLRALNLTGRERLVGRMLGDFTLHDIDPLGRLLVEQRHHRSTVVVLPPGESRERDLSWLDGTEAVDLSVDGRQILLMEWGGPRPALYLRKTDGSPAVRLGEEEGVALSPDGRWVLALPGMLGWADHLVLVPTGAGARRELRDGSLRSFSLGDAAWFPDARRIAVVGETEHRGRLFVWDVDMSAPPRPLSPEGDFSRPVVSPDGRSVVVSAAGEGVVLYPVDGGPARTLRGGATGDRPLRWSSDGRWLYVRRGTIVPGAGGIPAWIDRIETETGIRQPWKDLIPGDPAGVDGIGSVLVTPDGKSYAYSFGSSIGSLYLVDGLR